MPGCSGDQHPFPEFLPKTVRSRPPETVRPRKHDERFSLAPFASVLSVGHACVPLASREVAHGPCFC